MKVITAPFPVDFSEKTIFLAGTIDMGQSKDWQKEFVNDFKEENVTFLNPRRPKWNPEWKQEKGNEEFFAQVNWELNGIENANLIVMYFEPSSKSPVSPLELGILTRTPNRVLVCCPEGFHIKGNIDIVCERYGIQQFSSLEELKNKIKEVLKFV